MQLSERALVNSQSRNLRNAFLELLLRVNEVIGALACQYVLRGGKQAFITKLVLDKREDAPLRPPPRRLCEHGEMLVPRGRLAPREGNAGLGCQLFPGVRVTGKF